MGSRASGSPRWATRGARYFKMNVDGSGYQVLHDFGSGSGDGILGNIGSLVASGSTLYGTTFSGGAYDSGTIFKINTAGSGYQVLYSFNGHTGGIDPVGAIAIAGSTLYGTTEEGGAHGQGTVYAFTVPEPSGLAMAACGWVALVVVACRRILSSPPRAARQIGPSSVRLNARLNMPCLRRCLGTFARLAVVVSFTFSGAVARADSLYVSTQGAIVKIDTVTGQRSTVIDGYYQGLAVDRNGDLFAANVNNGTISEILPGGIDVPIVSGLDELNHTVGMTFDASGNLYVADSIERSILKIAPDHSISTFATGFLVPNNLAFDRNGDLLVADESSDLASVSPDGSVQRIQPAFNGLTYIFTINDLAFDSHGNLFLADIFGEKIDKITPAGDVSVFANPGFPFVNSIAVDSQDNLYVPVTTISNGNVVYGEIRKYAPDGTYTTIGGDFGQSLPSFMAIAVPEPGGLALAVGGLLVLTWA